MTALIGMCHLALQIGHDTKQLNDLRRINSASRSLLVIVNEGLKVSKIGAGKLWTELVSIKLSDLPDNLAERFCVRKHTPDRPNLRHG